ncbi:MAG: hypothetical protein WA532_04435 [Candidatus Korobacteraceae bacterium]
MRRYFLLSSILLGAVVGAVAQEGSGSSGDNPLVLPDPNRVIVQGCLSGEVGELTLTDPTGTSYQLTGNTQNMYQNIGHRVQVTGEKPSGEPVPGSMAAKADTNTDTPPSVSVISFEDVSPSCTP